MLFFYTNRKIKSVAKKMFTECDAWEMSKAVLLKHKLAAAVDGGWHIFYAPEDW